MKDRLKKLDDWSNQHRPTALLGIVALTIALVAMINYLSGSDLFRQFFFPKACDAKFLSKCDPLEWKELFQATVLILGLPVAFLVWHWRDVNKRADIDNARKDTNLKEFQEVQLRAAGALDEALPAEAREQLQIAALHQLRGFLRGDYGESFKRPAFELLLAGHAAAVYRIDVPGTIRKINGKTRQDIANAVEVLRSKLTRIDKSRMSIISDEAAHILTTYYPLEGRRFDLLDFTRNVFPDGLDFSGSHFFSTIFREARLNHANFNFAHLVAADFTMADLKCVNFPYANIENVHLSYSHLEDADLRCTSPHDAFELDHAKFNNHTRFGDDILRNWNSLTEEERAIARAPWLDRGMVNVDAPHSDEADGM